MNGTRGLVIATAAAFIVGCSVGLMGGILFARFAAPAPYGGPMFQPMRGGGPGGGPERPGGRDRMLPALERVLDLSPEQHERLVTLLDRARREHAAVRESMRVGIDRELTPAQRERWRQMEERYERSRRGRWSRDALPRGRP